MLIILVSCGYDRQEEYNTTESRYVREGDFYTCRGVTKRADRSASYTVDTIKTRTVTDWRPHSGAINTDAMYTGLNADEDDSEMSGLFIDFCKNVKNDGRVVEEGSAIVNSKAYEHAIWNCEMRARMNVNWPGDRHKDEIYNCSTEVKYLVCYIVPCYIVEFEYNGKTYCARGLAIGKANEIHEVPKEGGNIESIETIEKKRENKVAEAEKPLKIKKLFIFLSVIMGLAACFWLI